MARLNAHGTELARTEYSDCRVAVMSDGALMVNRGDGWMFWKRLKAGVDPVTFAAKVRAAYDARPAEFHAYIRSLVAACDLEHRAQLNALVVQMPEDPDAVWSLFDDPATTFKSRTSHDAAARDWRWRLEKSVVHLRRR